MLLWFDVESYALGCFVMFTHTHTIRFKRIRFAWNFVETPVVHRGKGVYTY